MVTPPKKGPSNWALFILIALSACSPKALRPSFWPQSAVALPLKEKLADTIPLEVYSLLKDDFKQSPNLLEAKLTAKEKAQVLLAIKELPLPWALKEKLLAKVQRIYFVTDLEASAVTYLIADHRSSFMVFDKKLLKLELSHWCSLKEARPFKLAFDEEIKCQEIGGRKDEMALSFVLLHELGHLYHSFIGDGPLSEKALHFDRLDLDYFAVSAAFKRVDFGQALQIYQKIEDRAVLGAYSLKSFDEYFAESFAFFFYYAKQKRRRLIHFVKKNKLQSAFDFSNNLHLKDNFWPFYDESSR